MSARRRGRWRVLARDRALGDRALASVGELLDGGRLISGPCRLGRIEAWLKVDRLRGRARLRHALRACVGLGFPRLREFVNLAWLRDHAFAAAEPLAAGVHTRFGTPATQFLFTRRIEGARDLHGLLESPAAAEQRPELLRELALELARMHALGFVHRDLFPRNILVLPVGGPVRPEEEPRRLVFLDAWRGGARRQWRGRAYDLACFLLEGARLLDADEQRDFLQDYLSAVAPRGGAAHSDTRLLGRVARERRRLYRALLEEPGRLRGRPLPPADWSPPALELP